MCSQVIGDGLIQSGLITQFRLPIRVGQASHIEYQVGVHRHAALKTKRLHQKRRAWLRLVQKAQLDGIAQLVQVKAGRVDLEVGEVNDRSQQLGFIFDGFCQRAMRAAEG